MSIGEAALHDRSFKGIKSMLWSAAIALLCTTEVAAETFSSRDGFVIILPSGWAEAPPEALQNIEASIREFSQGATAQKYDYGYQLSSALTWFEYPYILVQVNRKGRVPEGQLTQYKKLDAGFDQGVERIEKSLGGIASITKHGENLYDESSHILWRRMDMEVQGVGAVRAVIAVKLTEFGYIQLMGYATEDTFLRYAPVFQAAFRTLKVAEADRYRPRLTDHAPTFLGVNLGRVAIAALVGALLGGVGALINYLRNKRQGARLTS